MADDIVVRLRNWDDGRVFTHYEGCWDSHPVCAILLAADAIEAQQAQIERLRAVGDEMAHLIRLDHQSCKPKHGKSIEDWCTYCATIARWKEARRG